MTFAARVKGTSKGAKGSSKGFGKGSSKGTSLGGKGKSSKGYSKGGLTESFGSMNRGLGLGNSYRSGPPMHSSSISAFGSRPSNPLFERPSFFESGSIFGQGGGKGFGKGKGKGKGSEKGKGKGKGKSQRKNMVSSSYKVDEATRFSGTVKFFKKNSGYGLITPDDKSIVPDDVVMVHWKEIMSDDRWPSLAENMTVEFNLKKVEKVNKFEIQASSVTGPDYEPIVLQAHEENELEFVHDKNVRFIGNVVEFDSRKGFGKIKLQEGYDIDESISILQVQRCQIHTLSETAPSLPMNEEVEFGIFKVAGQDAAKNSYACFNVTLPGGEPFLNIE